MEVGELVLLLPQQSKGKRDILQLGKEIPHVSNLICGIEHVVSSVILLWDLMVSGARVNFPFYSQGWPPQEVLQSMLRQWHNDNMVGCSK